MKGNPSRVASVSFQDIPHMKTKCPAPLTALRMKTLMFCETRSLTWVVSLLRRERMSPAGGAGVGAGASGRLDAEAISRRLTCVVLVKEAEVLLHQDPVELVPDAEVESGEGQHEAPPPHANGHRAAEETGGEQDGGGAWTLPTSSPGHGQRRHLQHGLGQVLGAPRGHDAGDCLSVVEGDEDLACGPDSPRY